MIVTTTMRPTTLCFPQQEGDYVTATTGGQVIRRIRTPHPHDVLAGRGGGINQHPGNEQFREWVKVRKNDYNLALNKSDKAIVARSVIDQVKTQSPPGRFLQRDPTTAGSWWVELDDIKVMAKTSQALREGAPSIRAQYKSVIQANKKSRRKPAKSMTTSVNNNNSTAPVMTTSPVVTKALPSTVPTQVSPSPNMVLVAPLTSNLEFKSLTSTAQASTSGPTIIVPDEESTTPPLVPVRMTTMTSPESMTVLKLPTTACTTTSTGNGNTSTLSFSNLLNYDDATPPPPQNDDAAAAAAALSADFVNPFENEEEKFRSLHRLSGFNSRANIRNISSRALIDLDPIGSYQHWDDSEFDPLKQTTMDDETMGLPLDTPKSVKPIVATTTTTPAGSSSSGIIGGIRWSSQLSLPKLEPNQQQQQPPLALQ